MKNLQQERIGEGLVFSQAMIYGGFPVIVAYAGGLIPPIFFAAVSILLASIFLFATVLVKGKTSELKNRRALKYILMLTLFNVVLGFGLVFMGASMSSGINTSILLLVEIVFTFFLFGLFFGDEMPFPKIVAALSFPFGNYFAKKALKLVHPTVILFVRSILGGSFLLILSFVFEETVYQFQELIWNNWWLILLTGFVMMFLTKIIWYEGLKRLEVSKAITIGMTYSAFGVFYSILFLKERPSMYQIIGFVVVILGLYFITKKNPGLVSKEGLINP